ncbi:hypothetical protein PR202_gb28809 [Eleusine coracana subsp. coracana]|uniref:Uncharacterized protein n=1 Tax=Eleusine coracana subsp. coracana TaxID=191504 RepID=A0AAV5FZT3_ELECO|nr:hypothetical protein QOZ80_8BG0644910 [Eleusine coracana subsp. coracana]GJN39676.1 hypothetical protein PR202_gb28809 [Eleusine coracana subsp. coracana]
MSGGRKTAAPDGEEAEVEALLRAAQDAVMLKLQANSHLISSASAPTAPSLDADAAAVPDPLEADLARRFDALKSRPPAPAPKPAGAGAGGGMEELEERFAALKGAAGPETETRVKLEDLGGDSSEDEEEEVDKLMRWAMDAARLDVATAGARVGGKAKRAEEEEADKDEKSSVSSEDDDDEEERLELEMARKRKEMAKSKSKNKWFF